MSHPPDHKNLPFHWAKTAVQRISAGYLSYWIHDHLINMNISREQALSICNVMILSNFNYCPLIWLFCNKGANKKLYRAHKRALKILHNDYDSLFQSLLVRSNSFTIHVQNLQKLMTEIYMLLTNMNPSIVWEFHEKKYVAYDLRKKNLCKLLSYGAESLSFRGSFLWNTLDDTVKQEPKLAHFKNKRFMVFCNYVGWSKLVFINTILSKSTLNNEYMI